LTQHRSIASRAESICYFFGDIVNEGVLLLNSRRMQLAKPKALNAPERLALVAEARCDGEQRRGGYCPRSLSRPFFAALYQSRWGTAPSSRAQFCSRPFPFPLPN
jgi:hypothetical protein